MLYLCLKMGVNRQNNWVRVFWGLMALYLFNLSIDSPDHTAHYRPENLKINDIESVLEFLLESVLQMDDAMAEYDDPDTEDQFKKKTSKADVSHAPVAAVQVPLPLLADGKTKAALALYHLTKGYSKIDLPPPRA